MPSTPTLAIKVGIFFTIGLILLLGLSLQAGKGSFFSQNYAVVANFKHASGIDRGTQVTLRGVPIGTVRSIDWDPGIYRVRVVLEINSRYEIPRNAAAKIQVNSLLGGNLINISVEKGPEEITYLRNGDTINVIDTQTLDEVFETISSLSDDTQNLIRNLDANQAETLGKINEVIEENRAYIRSTSESFASAGPKLELLADRLNEMTQSVIAGEGTLGRLYADPELYDELKGFSDSANEIAAQIRSGEGTLGSLIYDDKLINEANTIMEDLRKAAQEIEAAIGENREGIRNLVSSLADAGPRIDEAITNFNEISGKINQGEGTLGRLVNDPSLYDDAQRTVNQIGETFDSGEEQGVFRSFLGLIFGALI